MLRWFMIGLLLGGHVLAANNRQQVPGLNRILQMCGLNLRSLEVAEIPGSLPTESLPLGIVKSYENPLLTTSIWHPVSSAAAPGVIKNLKSFTPATPLPQRFLLGDGSLRRAIVGIDQRPGTPLDRILSQMVINVVHSMANEGLAITPETVTQYLTFHLQDLANPRWSLGTDGTGDNRWDPPPPHLSAASVAREKSVFTSPVATTILDSEQTLKVVPLENFLTESCSAYCLQKGLIAKLILDRLKMPARLVQGGTITFDKEGEPLSVGHSWDAVMGSNGREIILDATQKKTGPVGRTYENSSDWYSFGDRYRFENQFYPILELDFGAFQPSENR